MQSFVLPGTFAGPPFGSLYPATNIRVTNRNNDTELEAEERAIINRIAQLMQSLGGNLSADDRAQLEDERRLRQGELEALRRGLPLASLQPDGSVPSTLILKANVTRSSASRASSSNEDSLPEPDPGLAVDAAQWIAAQFLEAVETGAPPHPSLPVPDNMVTLVKNGNSWRIW
jgi:hypothetical protein